MAISKISGSGLGTINSPVEFTSADNLTQLTLTSTDADSNVGPVLNFTRNSASPADVDFLANITFNGKNDAGQDVQYAEIENYALDVSDGTEDGYLGFAVRTAGGNPSYFEMRGGEGNVFNQGSNDIDFRVESNSETHALFVNGAGEAVVGIGQSSPTSPNDATDFLHIGSAQNQDTSIVLQDGDEIWEIYQNDNLHFKFDTTTVMQMNRLTGIVTTPLQPSFLASKNADQNNIATGTVVTVLWQVEAYDVGGNFASNTFTAPVTGKYILTASIRVDSSDSGSSHDDMAIATSNRLYKNIFDLGGLSGDPVFWTHTINAVADMDAGDTAFVTFFQTDGAAQADIKNDSGRTYFSGILVG